jgi:hypothetical protein
MRGSIYDNVKIIGGVSVAPQSVSGASAVNGTGINTTSYTDAVVRAYGAAASGAPSGASLVVTVQESSDNSTWSNALDNTGTVIGFTLTVTSVAAENIARIEGLGLNRKTYLRAVITPTFTGGTSPASIAYAELIMGGPAQQLPTDTNSSNT